MRCRTCKQLGGQENQKGKKEEEVTAKKEEGICAEEFEEKPREENGFSNRHFSPAFIPSLTSWPEAEQGWRLESSSETSGAVWNVVAQNPTPVGGRWTVTVSETMGRRFYRLVKP